MFCKLFFFYDYEKDSKILEKKIDEINEPYRIVTNSAALYEHFNSKKKNVHKINKIIPDVGEIAWEVFRNAEEIHKEYENKFRNIKFNDIEIFHGFEFPLLRQLYFLAKIKKILGNKQNTIFIFKRYYPIYFKIIQDARELDYEVESKINFINKNKIENITEKDEDILSHKDKFSRLRVFHYLKSNQSTTSKFERVKKMKSFLIKVISFRIKHYNFQLTSKFEDDYTKIILNKIDKKIEKTDSKFDAQYAVFITASRDDIYLRPWLPVLKKFNQEDIPFQIITSDLISGMALSNSGFSIVNFFEEVNIIAEEVSKNREGLEIKEKIIQITNENSLPGLKELQSYIIKQAFRSVAVIIICKHLIEKMKLKSIILAADGEMLENISNQICKKNGIPSYAIIWGNLEEQPLLSHWFHADKIFVEGTKLVEGLMNLGYNKNKMIITGNPVNDYLKNMETSESKRILEKKHSIKKNKKLVVVAMSRIHDNDGIWMSDLVKFCNKNDFEIVIKFHPAYKLEEDSRSTKMIELIKNKCKNLKFFITYDEIELYTLLSGSDLVITEYSLVGLDAIKLKKPMITVNFLNEDNSQFVEFHKYGASIYVNNYLKLEKTILDIFEHKKYLEELKNGRKKFSEGYGLDNSCNAAENIFNQLVN